MKRTFNQFETAHVQPKKSGWYNTDKGKLYWSSLGFSWSCRDDKISEEYPKFWYEAENIITPILFFDWVKTLSDIELQFWDDNDCPIRNKTTPELFMQYLKNHD